jgi:hypothetical protein
MTGVNEHQKEFAVLRLAAVAVGTFWTIALQACNTDDTPILPVMPDSTTVVLRESPTCSECRIRLEQNLIFSGTEALGGTSVVDVLRRDQRGRFYHVSAYARASLTRYSQEGIPEVQIGRQGRGPGEFQTITELMIGAGDTVYVVDYRSNGISMFNPDGEFVRTHTFDAPFNELLELQPGRLVGNPSSGLWGQPGPVVVRIRDGSSTALGGTATSTQTRPLARVRQLARESDTTFWVAHADEYQIELWDTTGRVLRRFRGEPEWFTETQPETLEGELNPVLTDLTRDNSGLLWLVFRVRDTQWEDRAEWGPEGAPGIRSVQSRTGDWRDLHDELLEVLDPRSGVVLATQRFDQIGAGFADPEHLYTYDEDSTGRGALTIWELSLAGYAAQE